jgi:transcriptional regulator with GAF, ATPase, and Fis domain
VRSSATILVPGLWEDQGVRDEETSKRRQAVRMKTTRALWWSNPPAVLRYAVAFVSVASAVILARGLEYFWRSPPYVSLFLLAIMFSAWFGGIRPALLAVTLSLLAFAYYHLPPGHTILVTLSSLPRLIILAVASVMAALLVAAQRSATESLRRARDDLAATVEELEKINETLRGENAARKQAEAAAEKAFQEIQVLRDKLFEENVALREEIDKASMFEEIVGGSPPLQAVLTRVARVAPTDSTVLITGETGTGKELVARAIHKRSRRAARAFVSVNCAAIPPSLIASELFGHEKGAFTGALQRRVGRFELAEGGTIFLDEVGELPMETQVALLRTLQEREFERVGGNQTIRVDVRVIAATNRDLATAISEGSFRKDLLYRLNVFPIEVPALHERREDIPLLVEYFIDRYANRESKKIRSVTKKSLDLLQAYDWPGNIRELQNVIERSVIVCESETLSVDETWLVREGPSSTQALTVELVSHEKEMIEAALAESRGRVSGSAGAAARLGIPASTLESKIRALKISKLRFKAN